MSKPKPPRKTAPPQQRPKPAWPPVIRIPADTKHPNINNWKVDQ